MVTPQCHATKTDRRRPVASTQWTCPLDSASISQDVIARFGDNLRSAERLSKRLSKRLTERLTGRLSERLSKRLQESARVANLLSNRYEAIFHFF